MTLAVASLKFLPHVLWHRAFARDPAFRSKPLRGGPRGQWLSVPESQTQEEINAERLAAYRLSGFGFVALCLLGAAILLALTTLAAASNQLSLANAVTIENATGPALVILGFLVWWQTRK